MSHIAIIGSGISGLAAAHYLKQAKHRVTVFEAADRLGGAVQTTRWSSEIMEAGPDSFLSSKPAAIELAKQLDIELVESCAVGTPSVVKGGRLLPLPEGFRLLAPTRLIPFAMTRLISLRGKLRAAAELFIPSKQDQADESVGNFVSRRFGSEILDQLAQPLIGGIYSADPATLSLQATFPFLQLFERNRGSVIKGMLEAVGKQKSGKSLFWAPKNGMGELIDRLAGSIGAENIRSSSPVLSLSREGARWVVECADGAQGFDGVVVACPAHKASVLLKNLDPDLAHGLQEIPYTSTAAVHLLFEESQFKSPLNGSGFVVPKVENLDITACTFVHNKYPGRAAPGKSLLRVNLGGQMNPQILKRSDQQLVDTAVETLRPLLGLTGQAQRTQVVRHHKVVPQYAVGHLLLKESMEGLLARHSSLALAGNGLHGVGLSDCVKQAEDCAKRIHCEVA